MPRVDSVSANDKTIRLHDGRTLGYAEYDIAEGKALFYFHGHPGARLEARFLAEQAAQAGVRLIGIDRPGMGLATFKAGRCFLDWPTMWSSWPTACTSTVLRLSDFPVQVHMHSPARTRFPSA